MTICIMSPGFYEEVKGNAKSFVLVLNSKQGSRAELYAYAIMHGHTRLNIFLTS